MPDGTQGLGWVQVTQPSLFDERAHARNSDPATSHAAADSLSSDKIRRSQLAVLGFLKAFGPMTDTALVERYARSPRQSPSGLRTRRRELTTKGLVYDTGKRVVLDSGRKAIVWAAK